LQLARSGLKEKKILLQALEQGRVQPVVVQSQLLVGFPTEPLPQNASVITGGARMASNHK
jgi:hypothetical protein